MIPAHDIDPYTGITEDTISRAAEALQYVQKDEVVARFVGEGMPRAVAIQTVAAGFILATHRIRLHLGVNGLVDADSDEETQV